MAEVEDPHAAEYVGRRDSVIGGGRRCWERRTRTRIKEKKAGAACSAAEAAHRRTDYQGRSHSSALTGLKTSDGARRFRR